MSRSRPASTEWPEGLPVGSMRFVRSSAPYETTIAFYRDLIGLPVIDEFRDSYGEDGTIFGLPSWPNHLEVVRSHGEAGPIDPFDQMVFYLPDEAAIEAALAAAADALRPGGVLAVDILDLDYGRIRAGEPPFARVQADWAIITEFSAPAPDRFVRDATTFVPDGAGAWRRGHERHENVLVDTSRLPELLAAHGVRAEVGTAFGAAELPGGLRSVTGRKDS